jgi:FkbM family methyltransferase
MTLGRDAQDEPHVAITNAREHRRRTTINMSTKRHRLPTTLLLKSLIVRTPLAEFAKKLRWLIQGRHRRKHPELWEMYLEEQRMPLVLGKVLKKDSCCVDVGGHIGSFTKLLNLYAPRGQHVVFEASPTKSHWLRKRFPNVTVFSYAVADKGGNAVFEEDCANPGYSALRSSTTSKVVNSVLYEVPTCRLDDVLAELNRVDLIKLDIEGGELAALRGSAELIERFKPTIIFECGSEYGLAAGAFSRLDLYNFITKDLGYKIFGLADFLYDKGEMSYDEFRKCGLYPFRGFNFVALHGSSETLDRNHHRSDGRGCGDLKAAAR